jgi:hypothetical protein
MDIADLAQVFGLGALGGTLVELLRWWKIREADRLPTYASKAGYWVITALMICAGGVMATLYGLDQHNAAALKYWSLDAGNHWRGCNEGGGV